MRDRALSGWRLPLLAAACVCLTQGACLAQPAAKPSKLSLERLREMRKQLAGRKRRIIANNDGCDCLYFPKNKEVTAKNFLAMRTTALAGTHVDTIAYCTISSGFSNFTHHTKFGTVLARQSAEFGILPSTRNIAQALIDQGADCLKLVVDYAHEHGMEAFWSMRMNDTHDVAHRPEKAYLLYPPLKVEYPEWLVGDHVKRTPHGRWSSVDYARPEIRGLAFKFIEEVCRNYDVDGVELDFFRHMCYFKSAAMGGKASQEERDMMTGLMRRVRSMTEEVGRERARPILVAVRVADSVEFNRGIGLDIERWLEDGLVDILITTCYFRLNPWDYSVKLGREHGVAVYPCLSDSRVRGQSRFNRGSYASYRGRAMNAWAAGAAGIHTFNHFNPNSRVFRECGDPEALRTMDKLYFATVRDGNPSSWLAGAANYCTVPILTPTHPKTIAPGRPLDIGITIGDDVARAQQDGYEPKIQCHLEVPRIRRVDQLTVRFNEHALSGGKLAKGWVDYPVPPGIVRQGANKVQIAVNPLPRAVADEWTIVCDGERKPAKPWLRDPGSARTEEKLVDGALFIADRGKVSGDYHYWRYPWGADASSEIVAEARVKVVSGSSFLIVTDGSAGERLGLWPDHIDLFHNTALRYDMDTTQDFHVYRVVIKGTDMKVFVDGELRIDAKGKFTPRAGYSRNEIGFGAANSGMVGEAHWDYVRARLHSQACKDVVVSVQYEKR